MRWIFDSGNIRSWIRSMCLARRELHPNLCREQHGHEAAIIPAVVPNSESALSLADISGHSLCTMAVKIASKFLFVYPPAR
jgi:hypothetical protein